MQVVNLSHYIMPIVLSCDSPATFIYAYISPAIFIFLHREDEAEEAEDDADTTRASLGPFDAAAWLVYGEK